MPGHSTGCQTISDERLLDGAIEMVYYLMCSFAGIGYKERNPLKRFSAALVTGFLSTVSCIGASAEQAPLTLCTAGPEGNYFATGRDMAARANPAYLKISVAQTSGSMDNMQRLARHECGAAIVQSDAYLVYQSKHRNQPVEITRNRFLYAEFAHLVCRRDAKVATTDDLLDSPGRHKILVGARESGSALSWHAFTILDERYGLLPAEQIGGEASLNRVLDGQAQCLFFVSGLGSELARRVDQRGENLRLVPITEDVLRNAEFGRVTLYEIRHIPKGTYRNLEVGLPDSGVATLSVSATLVIERHWSVQYPNGPSALLGAVSGAMPAITKRAMAGLN
jgi:TRAP transporter TAXI family solute receptor